MPAKQKESIAEIDASAVRDYLKDHPEFFMTHSDLLLELNLPHSEHGAISLVEKQVAVLRDRNKDNRKKIEEYTRNAKHNDDIFKKCQYMILGLMEAEDKDSFLKNLEKGFKRDFKSNAYSLMIFGETPAQVNHFASVVTRESANEFVSSLIRSTKPTLGTLRPTEQDFLFRHQSDKVKSAVVMSVREGRQQIALLAIGSTDPNYFRPGMGTVFIGFIADALAKLIPRYITGPDA